MWLWKKIFCWVILLNFFWAQNAAAAVLLLEPRGEVAAGKTITILVVVDTQNEDINAVEGTLWFSPDFLSVKKINDGSSVINFWLDKPAVVAPGQIKFSGITPGGYTGSQGLLFSVTFAVKNLDADKRELQITPLRILLNDGAGTATTATSTPLFLAVGQSSATVDSATSTLLLRDLPDKTPPEDFSISLSREEDIYSGKWFVVFATTDKESGVDRYLLRESLQNKSSAFGWTVVESPYRLRDQQLHSYIFVQAVDRSGNQKISVLPPANPLTPLQIWWQRAIIALEALGVLVLFGILWKKYRGRAR